MTRHTHCLLARCAWLAATATVLSYGGTAAAAELSVCIDTSSPVAAIDSHLAHAIAAREKTTLRIHSFDSSEGDDAFGLKDFGKLASRDCELVLGFPIDTDAQNVTLGGLQATTPYGHTGFVLVTPSDSKAASLDQLPEGTRVAVTYLTTPNIYFADHPGLQADVTLTTDAALDALATHAVGAAMVWKPAAVRYLAGKHLAGRFDTHALDESHARFNLVALYDKNHASAAAAFEQAVAAMQASGELQRVLAPYIEAGAVSRSSRRNEAMANRPHRDPAAGRRCATKDAATKTKSSAPPALYTEAQATSGKQKFLDNCAQCHGQDLEGMAGPALKGPNFASAQANFHVGDIFTIVTHNMPATQPGSLPHQDYVEIMAFLLQQNGYPAGSNDLTYDEAMQSKVQFIYRGK